MIQIDDKLVSLELLEEAFVCDLKACKGACCVEGDSGAPLTDDEVEIIEKEYPNFEAFLRPEGRAVVRDQGTFVKDDDGDWVTPLRDQKECAYTVFDPDGTAKCGIEMAWKEGKTTFQKPVSCHLYPVRTKRYAEFEAVNYEKWNICSAACSLGKTLQVPVFKFVETALKRKYGDAWFEELEEAHLALKNMRENDEKSKST